MSTGLLMLGNHSVERMVGLAKLAEESGYDIVWLADERFYREVYSCLTHFAAHTSRVLLGPCVTDPYARHPALTAMAIATLDAISGKRAVLGIGAGVSGFAELGIDRRKPPQAMREMIELIRQLLRGGTVQYRGEIISFDEGRLSFEPVRSSIPIYVASNGPLGQRVAGSHADAAIMEACGSIDEVKAFRAEVDRGSERAGRAPGSVKLVLRLNLCIARDGRTARDTMRPMVARYLGAGRLKLATLEQQGLNLPADALASVAGAHYAAGVKPYLPLLPLITDRHVNAVALAGTVEEIVEHLISLRRAGADSVTVMPFAPEGGSIEETVSLFGTEVWPAVQAAIRA